MRHKVFEIDTNKKVVLVRNLVADEIIKDHYDKLVMTTGSWPIVPPIPGIKLENILLSKNFNHAITVIEKRKK